MVRFPLSCLMLTKYVRQSRAAHQADGWSPYCLACVSISFVQRVHTTQVGMFSLSTSIIEMFAYLVTHSVSCSRVLVLCAVAPVTHAWPSIAGFFPTKVRLVSQIKASNRCRSECAVYGSHTALSSPATAMHLIIPINTNYCRYNVQLYARRV